MNRFICIHGHFYQPPRENPWLEEVELQDSAYPFHDWNERVTAECYAPNGASRILDAENRIVDIINNYSRISFNVGPTLCAWLDRHQPEVLGAMVEADRISKERFSGHGSAIAQVYNHMIMPLATRADKYTQVYWGIVDFSRRFGRFPEGMWLPETAVDLETLEVLSELNIRFTILAPRQAHRVRSLTKGARWHVVGEAIDPRRPYLVHLPSGRSITLFFYNGVISQEMAFGGLLGNGEQLAHRLTEAFDKERDAPQIVHVATDGESYGHHHRHGDMALSYCLHTIEGIGGVRLTNYGEFLQSNPPQHEVEIHENSSWSCVHGIERWRSDCGCNSGRPGWHQGWRAPLRAGLNQLRDTLTPRFEEAGQKLLADPWKARNDYLDVVLNREEVHVDQFLTLHGAHPLSEEEKVQALQLLELERNAMLMYTSCGWFFDDITGIETVQILQYAARAIQLGEGLFALPLEEQLLEALREAPSNVLANGEEAYLRYAKPACLDLLRIGAHQAISSLFSEVKPRMALYCYRIDTDPYQKLESGKFKLGLGRMSVTSTLTWESGRFGFAVLHLGDHNVSGGVRTYQGDEAFERMQNEMRTRFQRGLMTDILPLLVQHFGSHNFSLWHLFRDEQRRVLDGVLTEALTELRTSFRQLYDKHSAVMSFMLNLNQRIPGPLRSVAEQIAREDLKEFLQQDPPAFDGLGQVLERTAQWHFNLHTEEIALQMALAVEKEVLRFVQKSDDLSSLERTERLLQVLKKLNPDINLWRAQNAFFALASKRLSAERLKADGGDSGAATWVRLFSAVGRLLGIRLEQ